MKKSGDRLGDQWRFPTILFSCEPSSTASAPEYTQACPSRAQKEQTGFSPGHLVFFRLANYQLLIANRLTAVPTDNHRKLA
jgi:hypothetical protein